MERWQKISGNVAISNRELPLLLRQEGGPGVRGVKKQASGWEIHFASRSLNRMPVVLKTGGSERSKRRPGALDSLRLFTA